MTDGEKLVWAAVFAANYAEGVQDRINAAVVASYAVENLRNLDGAAAVYFGEDSIVTEMVHEMLGTKPSQGQP